MTPQRVAGAPDHAPFGYDEDGTPIAPYGLKADGAPRLSNRGRTAGAGFPDAKKTGTKKTGTAAAPPKKKPTAAERPTVKANGTVDYVTGAEGITAMVGMGVSVLGSDPADLMKRYLRIKPRHLLALRGTGTIIGMMSEPLGAAIGGVAPRHPLLASWLKGGNIPKEYATLTAAVVQTGILVAKNWQSPSQELADAGDEIIALRSQQIAQEVKAMMAEATAAAAADGDQEQQGTPAPAAAEAEPDPETQQLAEWYSRHTPPRPTTDPSTVFIPGQMSVVDFTEPPYSDEGRAAS